MRKQGSSVSEKNEENDNFEDQLQMLENGQTNANQPDLNLPNLRRSKTSKEEREDVKILGK